MTINDLDEQYDLMIGRLFKIENLMSETTKEGSKFQEVIKLV